MPTLSEADAKRLIAAHGIPVPREALVTSPEAAAAAANRLGFPVALKLCGAGIAHKTERGLVRLGLVDEAAVTTAAEELLAAAKPEDGDVGLLVAELVRGSRELIAGLVRDPQFGPCVMLGLGGIFTEALRDTAFRLVPLSMVDAEEMIEDLSHQELLGPLRGEPAVDREGLAAVVLALAEIATADPAIVSIDLNPLIVAGGVPVAVDALVEIQR